MNLVNGKPNSSIKIFDRGLLYGDAVFETITSELKGGGDIRLVGLGTFLVSKRKATTGRNPQTGAAINIPAANVPKFRAGKALKESLN